MNAMTCHIQQKQCYKSVKELNVRLYDMWVTNLPGTPSSAANRSPNSLAHSTQSSIVTLETGMKGHTSNAPSLGCSPAKK